MTLEHILDGQKVTADDWWNPLTDAVNANTNGLGSVNLLLGAPVSAGGISDLQSKFAADEASIAAAQAGVDALNTAVGIPWSGGTAQTRIEALEAAVGGSSVGGTSIPATVGTCGSTVETIQTETVTFDVVAGKRYKLFHTVQYTIATGTPTAQTFRYRVKAGATLNLDTGVILIREYIGPPPTSAWGTVCHHCTWVATFTGQATFGVGWFANAGASLTSQANGRELTVEITGIA